MSESLEPQAGLGIPTDKAPVEGETRQPGFKAAVLEPAVLEAETGFNPLAPQQVLFEQRVGYVVAFVIGAAIIGGTSPTLVLAVTHPWVALVVFAGWLLLLALLVFSSHFWPPIAYRHASWRLAEEGLEIRRGVMWRHCTAIPAARVQHVDVSQGPIQRLFDLGKLTIHTAGTQNASVELDGLEHAQAMRLRDQLIAQKESLDVT